jgi:RimJ/RimL family protein N-acetyltransferase
MRTSFILPLETERLIIRNWRETDQDVFHHINSDEEVMHRLGMVRDLSADFQHPAIPDTHPVLKRHCIWRLSRQRWRLLNRV